MNLLNPTNVWQANNLPNGINFSDGVISGTPTTAGTFTVPVTVTNELGTSTKNITIITRNRPGTEKFSILQNGVQVAQLTIPELRAMVQDGTAQTTYNCTNTQIILPFNLPAVSYNISGNIITKPAHQVNIAVNFCDFRTVTLEDETTTPGLILQFDKILWPYATFFDYQMNRWKYSYLRQWLNASGSDWFDEAYDTQLSPDELLTEYSRFANCTFLQEGIHGFLDYLPEDLTAVLQPVQLQTNVEYIQDFNDETIEDPDYINGYDVDITFDKIFIPSFQEMNLSVSANSSYGDTPPANIEGTAWAYYSNFITEWYINSYSSEIVSACLQKQLLGNETDWDSSQYNSLWNARIIYSVVGYDQYQNIANLRALLIRSRSAKSNEEQVYGSSSSANFHKSTWGYFVEDNYGIGSDTDYINNLHMQPAPAFVLC